MSESSKAPFKFGERLGIFLIVESARCVLAFVRVSLSNSETLCVHSLSTISVAALLSYIAYQQLRKLLRRRSLRRASRGYKLESESFALSRSRYETREARTDAGASSYFLNLMFAELIQAVGKSYT